MASDPNLNNPPERKAETDDGIYLHFNSIIFDE
jgi:hypothetical protein